MRKQSFFGFDEAKSKFIPSNDNSIIKKGVILTGKDAYGYHGAFGFRDVLSRSKSHLQDALTDAAMLSKDHGGIVPQIKVRYIGSAGAHSFYEPVADTAQELMDEALESIKEQKNREENKKLEFLRICLRPVKAGHDVFLDGEEILTEFISIGNNGQFNRRPSGYLDLDGNLIQVKFGSLTETESKSN